MKRIKAYKKGLLLVWLLTLGITTHAQIDTVFHQQSITYQTYMNLVGKNNLSYAAEKFNVSIAKADAISAHVFPDPELSVGTVDHGQRRSKMGYEFNAGLGFTLELGGKRKARINLANHQAELAQLLLEDFFRNLRADATTAFLGAMKERAMLRVKFNSYEMMKRLSLSDSIRAKLGAITSVDARQSRLEAMAMLNEVFQQEADWRNAQTNLLLITGTKKEETPFDAAGDYQKFERKFNLADLILNAQNQRADLLAALKSKDISKSMLTLAKANRIIDLGLNFGMAATSVVINKVAPTPSTSTVSFGLSIPLKFSNNNKGAMLAAGYSVDQNEVQYEQTLLQIRTEVTQAYYNYLASQQQVKQFAAGMLTDARKVLDGRVYSYKRGETSLLDVLTAQRTFNEVQQNYIEALNANAVALLELERTAGMWDIDF